MGLITASLSDTTAIVRERITGEVTTVVHEGGVEVGEEVVKKRKKKSKRMLLLTVVRAVEGGQYGGGGGDE